MPHQTENGRAEGGIPTMSIRAIRNRCTERNTIAGRHSRPAKATGTRLEVTRTSVALLLSAVCSLFAACSSSTDSNNPPAMTHADVCRAYYGPLYALHCPGDTSTLDDVVLRCTTAAAPSASCVAAWDAWHLCKLHVGGARCDPSTNQAGYNPLFCDQENGNVTLKCG